MTAINLYTHLQIIKYLHLIQVVQEGIIGNNKISTLERVEEHKLKFYSSS